MVAYLGVAGATRCQLLTAAASRQPKPSFHPPQSFFTPNCLFEIRRSHSSRENSASRSSLRKVSHMFVATH